MKPLKGKMSIELSLEDANYINELIERDTAKPMKEYEFDTTEGGLALCPRCEKVINSKLPFCSWCGQRVDIENYEL